MAYEYVQAMQNLQVFLQETEEDEEYITGSEHFTDQDDVYSDRDTDYEDEFDESYRETASSFGTYIGADKSTFWMKDKLKKAPEDEECNLDLSLPGPKGDAANVTNPISSWKLLFDDELINLIVDHTNAHIDKLSAKFTRERDCKKTDSREIYALIGLLYLGGLFKSSHTNVKDLWSADGTGISVFRTAMSYKRFLLLIRYICFDDVNSRDEREATDNFAAARELFEKFIAKCQEAYNIGKCVTIDDILVPYRGRCKFRQYIPKKKVRYGIKVFTLVDAWTMYTYNMEVYDKKQPEGPYKLISTPEAIAKRLMKPLYKSGSRNLTVDSRFTTYQLAKELLAQDITVVGTMRRNKPEIPAEFKSAGRRPVHSSLFAYRDDATLISYSPEKGKCTVLLSTMRRSSSDGSIAKSDDKKTPELLQFFDSTKGAVAALEEMIACYSANRITNKWPTVVFFSLLNIAAINSRIILLSTKEPPLKYKSRREFLRDLSLALVSDHVKYRSSLETLPRTLRMECAEVSGRSEEPTELPPPPLKKMKFPTKGRCTLCPRSKDKKTKTVCFYCMRLVCHGHIRPVCQICAEGDADCL